MLFIYAEPCKGIRFHSEEKLKSFYGFLRPYLPWPALTPSPTDFPLHSLSIRHTFLLSIFQTSSFSPGPSYLLSFLTSFKFYVWISPRPWGFPWPTKLMLLFPSPILPGTSNSRHLLYFYFMACISSKKYNLSSFHRNPEDVKLHEVRGLCFVHWCLQCLTFTGGSKGLDIEQ